MDTDGYGLALPPPVGRARAPSESPDEAPPGNGLVLVLRVEDFNLALKEAALSSPPARRGAP